MKYQSRKISLAGYYWPVVLTVVVLIMAVPGTAAAGGREYTTDADFDEGVLVGVEHETMPDQLQLSEEHVTLPFIWVPNNSGTVSKVDTETGDELGRYWVIPPGLPILGNGSPSRTTVDLDGSCWVGNRCAGTVVKIGLYEAGQWIDRNEDGICQTSQDLNNDGDITGDELLPWGQDECVLYEVVLIPGLEGTYEPGTFRCDSDNLPEWQPTGGVFGGALEFDGSDQHVAITGFIEIQDNNELSICMWVKADVITGNHKMWFTNETGGFGRIRCRVINENWAFQCGQGASGNNVQVTSPATAGEWTHFVGARRNNDQVYLYINGDLVDQAPFLVAGPPMDRSSIGGEWRGGDDLRHMFDGIIDDVAIFSRKLDATEISQLYNDGGYSFFGDSDLLVLWEFDEESGLTASDSSSNGNDGTLMTSCSPPEPPVWQPTGGVFGGALEFDGVDDYVDCGNPTDPCLLDFGTGNWSVCAWVKTTMLGTGGGPDKGVIYGKGGDNAGGHRYGLYVNENQNPPGRVNLVVDDNGDDSIGSSFGKTQFTGSVIVSDGEWHHVAGLRDVNELRLYIDGLPDGNDDCAGYDLSGTHQHNAYIGAITSHPDSSIFKHYTGLIDDVAVFSRALSETEILALMGGGASFIDDSGLVALWELDESSGITASDSSGNENHGTLTGGYDISLYDNDSWSTSPRGLAIDADNNLWAGTWVTKRYYYIDGSNGQILRSVDVSSVNHTAYGAVIDKNGILWSSSQSKNHILRLNPTDDSFYVIYPGHYVYGLGVDYLGHLFASGWHDNRLTRINIETGAIEWSKWGPYNAKGVACTGDNDVWVVSQYYGNLYRFDNNGNLKKTLYVGDGPTGVAVDAAGKVWACNRYDEYIKRIDPATNEIDLEKPIIGSGGHYSYSDMTGIIARTITTRIGTWTVDYDSGTEDMAWGTVLWTGEEPAGTSITVKARSSNDQATWSAWETAENGIDLQQTPCGRYLQIETTLQIVTGDVSPILYDLTVLPSYTSVTYDGDALVSTGGALTATAGLKASLRDEEGLIFDIDGIEVTFTLSAEGRDDIVVVAESVGGKAVVETPPLEPDIYTIEVTVECASTSAILAVYNPEGGFATGGGWLVPEADGLNTHPNARANFGFNAKYKQDAATGHIEFRYSDGHIDLKSSSIEQLVITGGKIAQFKGWASVNKEQGHWFFVKAIDNGEPGINDTFDIKVWAPGVSEEGDPTERAGGVLKGGNIVVHTKG